MTLPATKPICALCRHPVDEMRSYTKNDALKPAVHVFIFRCHGAEERV